MISTESLHNSVDIPLTIMLTFSLLSVSNFQKLSCEIYKGVKFKWEVGNNEWILKK